ncbi:MAG: PAS domain S-box protein [Desulfobacteraceae bacterium]|jgi:PAS domain S-box-containing protein
MGLKLTKEHTKSYHISDKKYSKDKHQISRIGDLFNRLGTDPAQNIHVIVHQACEVFNCNFALYHRIDQQKKTLSCTAGYNLPPNFPFQTDPAGHICYEATIKGKNQPVVLEDISKTPFQESDPYVSQFGLKSYLGCPILCNHQVIGSLAVADTRVRRFDETDIHIVTSLAKALSLEEERIRMDSALNKSELKYQKLYKMLRLLTDNVPDLIWAKDMSDCYIFANQAICDKLLKCKRPEEALGKNDVMIAQQERKAGQNHTFGEICSNSDDIVKKSETSGRFLEEGLIRNQYLVLDVHKAPFWGPNGEMIGTVGCGRDVTKEKQIENALKKSESRYRDLYNNTPVMLCSMDAENIITSASNLWLETLGYSRQEVIGHDFFRFLPLESRKSGTGNIFPEFRRSGQIKNYPCKFVTRNGKEKHVLLSAISQTDSLGNYDGALAFAVDVTATKKAEMENSRLSARLQQAKKMEAIATLAGGVAHQFNNALAVILGNLELIQMDGLHNAKIDLYVEPINQASQKMVQLTGQLLAYARGGKFQTKTISAHRFVTETLQIIQHSMAPYVDVETDLDRKTDHIEVDLTQMQMMLAAILSNASEAMEGQGRVKITLRNTNVSKKKCRKNPGLKPGRQVLLRFADNGKGMDEQTRIRIFEPFFTTKFQGRGLGMAAVYGIVKKHGGYVYVESSPGQGTTVSIYLPGIQTKEQVAEKTQTYAAKPNRTALIVEDEHLVMEVNRAIVEKLGYHVLEAKSGKEAIEIARQYEGDIDFAMLDVILPDMDGSMIYPKLMEHRPGLLVVVCSGFALDGPARQILESGAQSFIQKPFTVAALSAVLKKIFKELNREE